MPHARTLREALELFTSACGGRKVSGGIGPRVELDHRRPQFNRGLQLGRVGVNKETRDDSRGGHRSNNVLYPTSVTHHVQATLGRDFLPILRHQADGIRSQANRKGHHGRCTGHLQIQTGPDALTEALNVAFLNVTSILSKVNRNPVCTGPFCEESQGDRVRLYGPPGGRFMLPIPRLPYGRHVVNVHTKEDHGPKE